MFYYVIKNTFDKELSLGAPNTPRLLETNIVNQGDDETILDSSVLEFVKNECGTRTVSNLKIIEINGLDQVCEPIIDTPLIYRVKSESNRLYVYLRESQVAPAGYFYRQSVVSTFWLAHIFTLTEFPKNTYKIPDPPTHSVNYNTPVLTRSVSTPIVSTGSSNLHTTLLDEMRTSPVFVSVVKAIEADEKLREQKEELTVTH